MFRVIKLVIVLLIVHAAWRVGSGYWRFYQFEDGLQDLAQFGEQRTDKQICEQLLDKAANLDLPMAADEAVVRRGSNTPYNCDSGYKGVPPSAQASGAASKLFIDARYTDELQLLPGYRYPWEFKASVNAYIRP